MGYGNKGYGNGNGTMGSGKGRGGKEGRRGGELGGDGNQLRYLGWGKKAKQLYCILGVDLGVFPTNIFSSSQVSILRFDFFFVILTSSSL